MKALVLKPFTGMDGNKERDFKEGDVIEGGAAQWACDNGHGEEVDEDEPTSSAEPAPPPPQRERERRRSRKGEGEGE